MAPLTNGSAQNLPDKADACEEDQAEPPNAAVSPKDDRRPPCGQPRTPPLAPEEAQRLICFGKCHIFHYLFGMAVLGSPHTNVSILA
jgi:hypothetical protein